MLIWGLLENCLRFSLSTSPIPFPAAHKHTHTHTPSSLQVEIKKNSKERQRCEKWQISKLIFVLRNFPVPFSLNPTSASHEIPVLFASYSLRKSPKFHVSLSSLTLLLSLPPSKLQLLSISQSNNTKATCLNHSILRQGWIITLVPKLKPPNLFGKFSGKMEEDNLGQVNLLFPLF